MSTRKLVSKHVNVASTTYVGRDGEIWVDTVSNLLKISDGATPGGVVITTDGIAQGDAVAIGTNAGLISQGNFSVAIGYLAGEDTQGIRAVAIGQYAGETSQGADAVAIGAQAGETSQGGSAVAMGRQAGNTNQGERAIAIGDLAGRTNQAANSIVINAAGGTLNNTVANTFVVKPVRGAAGATLPAGFKQVAYNPTTGEFIYYDA